MYFTELFLKALYSLIYTLLSGAFCDGWKIYEAKPLFNDLIAFHLKIGSGGGRNRFHINFAFVQEWLAWECNRTQLGVAGRFLERLHPDFGWICNKMRQKNKAIWIDSFDVFQQMGESFFLKKITDSGIVIHCYS